MRAAFFGGPLADQERALRHGEPPERLSFPVMERAAEPRHPSLGALSVSTGMFVYELRGETLSGAAAYYPVRSAGG